MLTLLIAQSFGCPDLNSTLDLANAAMVEVRPDDVAELLAEAEQALGCGTVAAPETLAKLWLIEGVNATIKGDDEGAIEAFSALARTDRTVWNDVYGPDVLARYEQSAVRPQGIATLRLVPDLGSNVAWIDGRESTSNGMQIAGLHTLQVADTFGRIRFGKSFYLAPDQVLEIHTGVAPGPPLPKPQRRRLRKKGWFITSIAAAAGGVVGLGLGAAQSNRIVTASTLEELNRASAIRTTLYGLGAGSLGFAGVSGLMFALGQREEPVE